jgi:hypothetical protein
MEDHCRAAVAVNKVLKSPLAAAVVVVTGRHKHTMGEMTQQHWDYHSLKQWGILMSNF